MRKNFQHVVLATAASLSETAVRWLSNDPRDTLPIGGI